MDARKPPVKVRDPQPTARAEKNDSPAMRILLGPGDRRSKARALAVATVASAEAVSVDAAEQWDPAAQPHVGRA